MKNPMMKRLEDTFYRYASQYDANILALFKEKDIQLDLQIVKEILHEAKRRGVF